MEISRIQLSTSELEQGVANVLQSPNDNGHLHAIFVRPEENERSSLSSAELSPDGGIAGERWATNHWQKLPDGRSDPRSQVSLMNYRILQLIAGGDEAMHLAGDNLILDLDLSEDNIPAGSRLRINEDVVLEITGQSHTGCEKFSQRYGPQARKFINSPLGSQWNLRGRFARIVDGGTIHVGDVVAKV